jgi:hypothetical protein
VHCGTLTCINSVLRGSKGSSHCPGAGSSNGPRDHGSSLILLRLRGRKAFGHSHRRAPIAVHRRHVRQRCHARPPCARHRRGCRIRRHCARRPRATAWPCSIVAAVLWSGAVQAAAVSTPEPQRSFPSAEEAAKAFVAAVRDHQQADFRAILGPEGNRVVDPGDRYADQERHQRFVALYDEKRVIDQKRPAHAEQEVGPNDWPLPIPLVESNGRCISDTKAGAQTIIDCRPTSCRRSARCSPASMLSTIISIAPSSNRQRGLCPPSGQHPLAPRRSVLARGRG